MRRLLFSLNALLLLGAAAGCSHMDHASARAAYGDGEVVVSGSEESSDGVVVDSSEVTGSGVVVNASETPGQSMEQAQRMPQGAPAPVIGPTATEQPPTE